MRSFTKVSIGWVTALTMAIATFPFVVFSVLAVDLIDEFDITRAQLGLLASGTGLFGAITAPYFGRLTDRIGSYRATVLVLVAGSVTLLCIAAAPTYVLLFLASMASGIPNGWGNAATNTLIVDHVSAGERGVLTGVKQSGVQIGTFLGGALLPVLAFNWGWRGAAAVFVLMPIAGLAGMVGRRSSHHHQVNRAGAAAPVVSAVRWIALYGTVSGLATAAIFVFLPLFAEEDQGWGSAEAGSLIAIVGLVGVVARIFWSRQSERTLGHGPTLRILALLSTASSVLLALNAVGLLPSWVLIPVALLLAFGSIAWNAVGMLAVMELSPVGGVGRGTGVVLMGFLLGYSLGAPILGWSVDVLGSYVPGWWGCAVLMALTSVIAGKVPTGSTLRSQ